MQEVTDITSWIQSGITISAGGGALVALAFYLRRVFKGMGLEDVQRAAAVSASEASETILSNLQAEVDRLSKRVETLEGQVHHLTEKLANVRLSALECYEIALSCHCDSNTRDDLLDKLRHIIKDA